MVRSGIVAMVPAGEPVGDDHFPYDVNESARRLRS
jgi:hypothetical protein